MTRSALRLLLVLVPPLALLGAPHGGALADTPTAAQKAVGDESLKLIRQAGDLESKKKYAEAIPLAEKALALREKGLGADAHDTIVAVSFVAEILEKKGDFAKAVPLLERVLAYKEKGKGSSRDIEVQFATEGLARVVLKAGDAARAVKLYEQTLKMREKRGGAESEETALGLWSLAGALRQKGDLDQAETTLARAISTEEKTVKAPGGKAVLGSMLLDLGRLQRQRGKYAKAAATLERSLSVRQDAWGPTHGLVADVAIPLAQTYAVLGDFGRAEPLLLRAVKIVEQEASPDDPELAAVNSELAVLYDDRGDYARAEPIHRRALEILEKKLPAGDENLADARVRLGRNLMLKGSLAQAEPLLTGGLAALEKAKGANHADLAPALSAVAELYRKKGELTKAEASLSRALAIHQKALGAGQPAIAADQTALARLAEAKGEGAKAEKLYEQALAIREKAFGKDHPEVAATLLDLARLHRRGGRAAKAEPLYQRALGIVEKGLGADHVEVAEALEGLAALQAAAGNADAALKSETRAADVLEQNTALVLASGSEAQKRDFLAGLSSSTDFAVSLHAQVAPKNDAALKLALTTVLQRKGRVLDVMSDTLAALRRRLDKESGALLEELARGRAQLAAAALRGPGEGAVDAYRASVSELEQRVQKLEEKISAKVPSFRSQETPASIARVQAAMPENSVLVEYFLYRPTAPATGSRAPRYAAYTLTPKGKVAFADLGESAPIDEAALRLRKALSSPDSRDAKDLARALDDKIMKPVRALLGTTSRVLVSPDGALNVVPFAALVDEGGKLGVERFEFTYLTSGRDLLRQQFKQSPKSAALIVANPAFGRAASQDPDASAGGVRRSAGLGKAVFDALPGTAGEGRAVAGLLPGASLKVDTEATESALKQTKGPRILHVATHGFFLAGQKLTAAKSRGLELDEAPAPAKGGGAPQPGAAFENPLLRSGLALAGANARKSGDEDGILTALEAAGLDLDGTQLVVLSACETGLGELQNGDGVYGLRRAFVLAGAETEVASLWKVADAETRDLMVAYYGKLQHGGGRSAALREVQRAMLAKSETAHPYYWASFVVSGDPSPLGSGPSGSSPAGGAKGGAPGSGGSSPAGKVAPGARGCACDVPAAPSGGLGGALAGLLLAASSLRRRRSAQSCTTRDALPL